MLVRFRKRNNLFVGILIYLFSDLNQEAYEYLTCKILMWWLKNHFHLKKSLILKYHQMTSIFWFKILIMWYTFLTKVISRISHRFGNIKAIRKRKSSRFYLQFQRLIGCYIYLRRFVFYQIFGFIELQNKVYFWYN